jgi:hypothetical protein
MESGMASRTSRWLTTASVPLPREIGTASEIDDHKNTLYCSVGILVRLGPETGVFYSLVRPS